MFGLIIKYWKITLCAFAASSVLFGTITHDTHSDHYENPIPKHTSLFFIEDYSHVLSSEIERFIYNYSVDLYKKTKAQVVVVTVPDTEGFSLENYSLDILNTWKIGDKDLNNGILLLFTTTDPHVRFEVGKGLEGDIPDAKAGRILDKYAVEYKNKRLFDQAALRTYAAILRLLYKKYHLELSEDLSEEAVDSFLSNLPDAATPASLPDYPKDDNGNIAEDFKYSQILPQTKTFGDADFPERVFVASTCEGMFSDLIVGCFITFMFCFVALLYFVPLTLCNKFCGGTGGSYGGSGYSGGGSGGGGYSGGGGGGSGGGASR